MISQKYEDDIAEEDRRCSYVAEDGGRISDVPDVSSESDVPDVSSESDEREGDEGESGDSDDDEPAYPSVHYKTYPWQMGAFYKVFWVQENKWLTGQYISSNKLGVKLYYEVDDTDAVHLYRDKWRIIPDKQIREVTVDVPVGN